MPERLLPPVCVHGAVLRHAVRGDERPDGHLPAAGGFEDCDFSGAEPHLCTFHNRDPATLNFPGWPHVTVPHPRRNGDDWLAIPFLQSFRSLQKSITYCNEQEVACVLHWPTFAKKAKDGMDPEAIRRLLVGKDYIRV